MKKRNGGKAWFYRLGVIHGRHGYALNHVREIRKDWPLWARTAWVVGWMDGADMRRIAEGGTSC